MILLKVVSNPFQSDIYYKLSFTRSSLLFNKAYKLSCDMLTQAGWPTPMSSFLLSKDPATMSAYFCSPALLLAVSYSSSATRYVTASMCLLKQCSNYLTLQKPEGPGWVRVDGFGWGNGEHRSREKICSKNYAQCSALIYCDCFFSVVT